MQLGTKSVLFGVHNVVIHPITVALAWRDLYGRWPHLYEWIAIILHDIGYWGKPNMDGEEGRSHPYLGAKWTGIVVGVLSTFKVLVILLARRWLTGRLTFRECAFNAKEIGIAIGAAAYNFSLCHSSNLAKNIGKEPSPLCWADKLAVLYDPKWLYLFRACASGEINEYTANAPEWISQTNRPRRVWYRWYLSKAEEKARRNAPKLPSK